MRWLLAETRSLIELRKPRARPSAFYRSRPWQVGLGLTASTFSILGFLPQFAGPGYESSLAAGLLLPALAAVCSALDGARHRHSPSEALSRGISGGLSLAFVAYVVACGHGMRAGFCDVLWGTELYWLGGGAGTVMGGAWGALAGVLVTGIEGLRLRSALASGLAVLGPLSGIVLSVARFMASPMAFAFDPFFGYFAGPLYDTVIDGGRALGSYRLGSLSSLVAAGALAQHLRLNPGGKLSWVWPGRPGVALLGIGAAVASSAVTYYGPELGHYQTTASIGHALGRTLSGKRCEVLYSSTLREREVRLFLRDCDGHVRQIERFFEAQETARVRVYLFASESEKGRLTGASRTSLAKPWRQEIYLQFMPHPHPVLGHEIAHVVAGGFGQGPFRVAGWLGGLVPDPGRIEGFAVAAVAKENEELALQDWAAALLRLELLPELESVFDLDFLGKNASTAYTAAGAFVEWFRSRNGASALKRWYSGEKLTQVTGGQGLGELERKWREELAARPVLGSWLSAAKSRFGRPSLFGRKCPRIVDRLIRKAAERLAAGDIALARLAYTEVLKLDSGEFGARLGLGTCAFREGDVERAERIYAALATDSDLNPLERARSLEFTADTELWLGRFDAAQEKYRALETVVLEEDRLRSLDVKRAAQSPIARVSVRDLLVGDPTLGQTLELALVHLSEWAHMEPDQGLPWYLIGKNLFLRGYWQSGAEYLDGALRRGLPGPRVVREALRTQLLVACALEDPEAGARAYRELLGTLDPARQAGIAQLWQRCFDRPIP